MKRTIAALVWLAVLAAAGSAWADVRREVSVWVGRDVAPGPKVRLSINTRNLPVVHIAAYRLDGISWLLTRDEEQKEPPRHGEPVRQWSVTVARKEERYRPWQQDIYRSRQVNLPPLTPGVYLLVARGGDKEAWAVANVTNLAVVVKRSAKRMLTWVCDAATGTPVEGARVTLYERTGKAIESGATRADGTCLFAAHPVWNQTIIVSRRGDLAAVPSGVASPDGRLRVHFQADRPIYRPGQTVLFKASLRRTAGRGYTPAANTGCVVQVRDAKDNVLLEKKAETNALGTLSDQFDIPSEGMTGSYSIVVKIEKESAYESFRVEEYRKPEFKVTVKPAERRYLAGEDAAFEIQAAYYFGAPVPQAEVRYSISRQNSLYGEYDEAARWYESGGGNLYPEDSYRHGPFVVEGTLYADDAGKVRVPFKTDKFAPDSTYSIQCTVKDASRRQVQSAASVPVYAAAIRLGISTDVLVCPVGAVIPLRLRAVDLDGKPTSAQVTITVAKPVWVKKEGRYRLKELTRTMLAIPASGKSRARLPAGAEGELVITATALDGTGRKAAATISIWVAGPFATLERAQKEPTVVVGLDRRTYSPGDTVTAWIRTNITGRPILVTAEGRDIWDYAVLYPTKKSISWKLKTDIEMSPNAYIEAGQWTRARMVSDSALVPIPDLSRKMSVRVEPERAAYRPGETATMLVSTKGEDGKPVSAEVAITVVDEAIYALEPDRTRDPYALFWGVRGNNVVTNRSAPEEVSGGAYQRVARVQQPALGGQPERVPVRERFLDTAYWSAHVLTAADGTASISFETPGNLTTWRATARAVTTDTRVGSGIGSMQASRPVMLRLATPRHIVKGDRLTLIGTVNNRTDKDHEFETMISAEGLRIEGDTTKRVRVAAGGEGRLQWTLAADSLPESGQAVITGRTIATDAPPARAEDYADALRVRVRVSPPGVMHRIVVGATLAKEKTAEVNLPTDRIEPASTVSVSVRSGLRQVMDDMVRDVVAWGRYGSPGAANHLLIAPLVSAEERPETVREALALLSRYQHGEGGWGWWDTEPPDPVITAQVLAALARARSARIAVPETLVERGIPGAISLHNRTNLWEHRALLAAAVTLAGYDKSSDLLKEIHRRATSLSPYAQALLAEAYLKAGKRDWADESLQKCLANAVIGPRFTYVPAGEHPGWSASAVETTAQALSALVQLSSDSQLQARLAQWLADPEENGWMCQDERAAAARALADYLSVHPDPTRLGALEMLVNGTRLEFASAEGKAVQAAVPRSLLRDGSNSFTFRRTGDGEVFLTIEARVFRPAQTETASGMRLLRRYEVRNAAGLWDEVSGPVKPAEPVRCTVLVWPDDRPDAIRVVEPLPAGFEFVDSDYGGYARQEVRDVAVIHYLRASGKPVFFRYYLRAESEGAVAALPAAAEALRRPSVRGNTATTSIQVSK